MKNRKLLVVGLCGALCLSLAGFTYASAQAADAPKTSAEETAQMSSTDIFFNDADGISTDGENWVAETDYEKNNPAPDVEWWTAEEYEQWIATQKEELEALIGTGDGWYDGQGVFHEWTQESVDATIAEYQETLESIKNGTLYSKDNGEGDTYSMIPPTEDVVSEYGVISGGSSATKHSTLSIVRTGSNTPPAFPNPPRRSCWSAWSCSTICALRSILCPKHRAAGWTLV